jgi:alpha-mannosidase
MPSEIVSSDSRANTYRLLVKAKDVPSLGYAVLHVVPGKKPFTDGPLAWVSGDKGLL